MSKLQMLKANHNIIGERFTEGTWDDLKFEVAGRLSGTVNNILSGLSHCASKRITEMAVIDFPNANFNQEIFTEALRRYRLLENSNPKQYLKFKRIICVQNEEIVLDMEF